MDQKLPQHVAIVMDGNGRWAENRGMPRVEGHRAGIEAVKKGVQFCLEKQIRVLSLFAFSSENWSRPENEVDFLMQLFIHALEQEINELHSHEVQLRFTGARVKLSPQLRERMNAAEFLTRSNQRLVLNIAVNYSGKWDLLEAAKKLALQVKSGQLDVNEINEEIFAQHLHTFGLPDPDLLIRTSGEQRISNFFLWQLAYTELYFSKVHWPDFTEEEFNKAILSFSQRERRYGKTSKQLTDNRHV